MLFISNQMQQPMLRGVNSMPSFFILIQLIKFIYSGPNMSRIFKQSKLFSYPAYDR
ncbi:hypothetical protein M153_635000314 [Pseudoloma neurophilia]|uniref:Uncharacterized protein n=1 Tax=Pseudoloma neurophilia TaxID=146866 RepID=A0A0R0LWZ3_9MICR|nr:hypothetical protein M153_635000314 [Pseudoloma neurophilia]